MKELRVIGRGLRIKCREVLYEGLLAMVTKTTLVLHQAQKYTPEQMQERRDAQRRQQSANNRGAAQNPRTTSPAPVSHSPSPAPAPSFLPLVPPANSPPVLPYVTINKKVVQQIDYAEERKFHYDAGQQPPDGILRIFVRRFIVHDSQGNNPSHLTLTAFLQTRLNWVAPDAALIFRVESEEKREMEAMEAELVEYRERAVAQQAAIGAGGPHDEFTVGRHILYATGIPAKTAYCAVFHMAIGIAILLYSASAYTTTEKNVLTKFVSGLATWACVVAVIEVCCGASTGLHALRMRVPLSRLLFFSRACILFISFSACVSFVVASSYATFKLTDVSRDRTLEQHWKHLVTSEPASICNYVINNRCSGYSVACSALWDVTQCVGSCSPQTTFRATCKGGLENSLRTLTVPDTIMSYIALLIHVCDWLLAYRLLKVVRETSS